jgi:hypothetical protein
MEPIQAGDDRPAALVDGRPVAWDRLVPGLVELAGGQVLEEAVLDDVLERRCAERGIAIGPEAIAGERSLLIESLDASPDRAEVLLKAVRASRRMGEVRFTASLKRSAMMRALVGEDAAAVAGEVATAVQVKQSERSVVRIIATAGEADAAAARARVMGPDGSVDAVRFAGVAAEVSQDDSALRGGMFGEVSEIDSGLPASLRKAVAKTDVGRVTPVIATGSGFVVAFVEKRLPARGELSVQERAVLEREVRVRAQRRAMELLAQQILSEAKVVPMDRGLGWSWGQRGR